MEASELAKLAEDLKHVSDMRCYDPCWLLRGISGTTDVVRMQPAAEVCATQSWPPCCWASLAAEPKALVLIYESSCSLEGSARWDMQHDKHSESLRLFCRSSWKMRACPCSPIQHTQNATTKLQTQVDARSRCMIVAQVACLNVEKIHCNWVVRPISEGARCTTLSH